MHYRSDDLAKIEVEMDQVLSNLRRAQKHLVYDLARTLSCDDAREYAVHGVGRRLELLRRTVFNVFQIFPTDRETLLSHVERIDPEINLHAFLIHVQGILDNIAWVFVHENALLDQLKGGRLGVGIHKKQLASLLPDAAQEFLNTPTAKEWQSRHSKDFRDALAHRIAPYIPPYRLDPKDNEQYAALQRESLEHMLAGDFRAAEHLDEKRGRLEFPIAVFLHSLADSIPISLHPQLLADVNTVLEIMRLVFAPFEERVDVPDR